MKISCLLFIAFLFQGVDGALARSAESSLSLAAKVPDKEALEDWRRLGLSYERLREEILNLSSSEGRGHSRCTKSSRFLLSCVQALNEVLLTLNPPMVLLPPGVSLPPQAQLVDRQNRFQPLILARWQHSAISERQLFSHRRQWQRAWSEYLEQAPNVGTLLEGPFLQVRNQLEDQRGSQDSSLLWAFHALRGFYRSFFHDHSGLVRKSEILKRLRQRRQDVFGFGLRLGFAEGVPVVTQVLPNAPAARENLQAMDRILKLNGRDTSLMSSAEVFQVLGKEGAAEVRLQVLAMNSDRPRELQLRRQRISLPHVSGHSFSHSDRKLGWLTLRSFLSQKTCSDVQNHLEGLLREGVEGLILDVRGNGGGLVDQAVCVADLFLPRELLVTRTQPVNGLVPAQRHITQRGMATALPVVVLVDEASASASEILAGALADHDRALLVGQRTFGKGTTQLGLPLPLQGTSDEFAWEDLPLAESDQLLLLVTTARFYQPGGTSNQLVGLQPHLLVFRHPDQRRELELMRESSMAISPVETDGEVSARVVPSEVSRCLSAKDSRAEFRGEGLGRGDFQFLRARDTLVCQLEVK